MIHKFGHTSHAHFFLVPRLLPGNAFWWDPAERWINDGQDARPTLRPVLVGTMRKMWKAISTATTRLLPYDCGQIRDSCIKIVVDNLVLVLLPQFNFTGRIFETGSD